MKKDRSYVRWDERHRKPSKRKKAPRPIEVAEDDLSIELIALRPYTHTLLRRYVYARYQAARVFSCLNSRLDGRASSRPIRTFEDALVFVIDMDRCLAALPSLDREILRRTLMQNYTQDEMATLLGMSPRTVSYKFSLALDRLTQRCIESQLLIVPDFLKAVA
jgi:DNA-directed RNA polymerase specialized sigma24 family protein